MKRTYTLIVLMGLVVMGAMLTGCNKEEAPPPAPATTNAPTPPPAPPAEKK
jgi:hypothetical protein